MTTAGQKRLVLAGASGMVGGYALRYALDNTAVSAVTAIGRTYLGLSHQAERGPAPTPNDGYAQSDLLGQRVDAADEPAMRSDVSVVREGEVGPMEGSHIVPRRPVDRVMAL